MNNATVTLSNLEYPGRLIILGAPPGGGKAAIVYAITGRSPSSQARMLVLRDSGIWVQPTDEAVLKTGNVDLLVYPAVLFGKHGLAVSNGKQTADIRDALRTGTAPVALLSKALATWDFEPDAPIFTPRISGCLRGGLAGLSVVRRGPSGETLRNYFDFPLREGEGRLVSTYEGPNREPLPVFEGEPRRVVLACATARETAEMVYQALAPARPEKDFRVAVASVILTPTDPENRDSHIINRQKGLER